MSTIQNIRALIRSNRITRKLVPLIVRATPDLRITREIDYLGRFTFGLRSHRWMLDDHPLSTHDGPLAMFDRVMTPDSVIYDIGANIGYYTRFFLKHYPSSKVLCFEPMKGNLRVLRQNIAYPEFEHRVQLFEIALSDHDGIAALQVDDICGGTAVLDEISGGEAAAGRAAIGLGPKCEDVLLQRLDELFAAEQLPPPSVIKVDTEGAELSVLRGGTDLLRKYHPHLCLALHGSLYGEEIGQFLADLGYITYGYATDGNGISTYRRLEIGDFSQLDDGNILCSTDVSLLSTPLPPLDFNYFAR